MVENPNVISWGGGGKDWSRKDLPQSPDKIECSNEVFARIRERLYEAGLIERSKGLKRQDIFIPKIRKKLETERALEELGLSGIFNDRSIIFIQNERYPITNDEITISTVYEALEEKKQNIVNIHLNDLFSEGRRVSDIYLQYGGRVRPCIFERIGIMKGDVLIGEFTNRDEYVMLVVDEQDGVSRTLSLALSNKWRDAVNENGKLIEEVKKEQKLPELENPTVIRERELRDIVARGIGNHLEKLGLAFNPQDISLPSVQIGYAIEESGKKAREALNDVGLPGGFSVIWVGKQREKSIIVSGRALGFRTELYLGSATNVNIIASLKYDHGRNPSVFIDSEKIEDRVIVLGSSFVTGAVYVLLIVDKDGKHEISSVALPHGWGSIFNKEGKWIEQPKEKPAERRQESVERLKKFCGDMPHSQQRYDWVQETNEKPPAPIASVIPEGQVSLETPKETREPYTPEQLENMRRAQWGEYDEMRTGSIHAGRSGRYHAGSNHRVKQPVSTLIVDKLFQDTNVFLRSYSPLTGSPRPGFKDRTKEDRKDESKRYRTQKEQRKAEFHKRQKGK